MPPVTKRATARRDLIEHFVYLAENASEDLLFAHIAPLDQAPESIRTGTSVTVSGNADRIMI